MKIVRFLDTKGSSYWGIQNGATITKLKDDPFGEIRETMNKYILDEIKVIAPCTPTKVIGLGLNFKESYPNGKYPSEPVLFLKGNNSIIGQNEPVVYPSDIKYAWMEAELAIVIKSKSKHLSVEEARKAILGYTIGNDITAENINERDHHLARSKSIDTFAPIGPHIETDLDTSDIRITSWLNNEKVQETTTAHRVYSDAEIVSKISALITLFPGDVILTGTAPGKGENHIMTAGVIQPGDTMRIEIEGIGILENRVL